MYNNYNPYYGQNRFQMPMYQPMQPSTPIPTVENTYAQKPAMLQGKSVDSIEVVKAIDIPLDGSTSFFPLADGSAIVTKQLSVDGTSKITVFKPESGQKNVSRYITTDELEKTLSGLNISELDGIKDDIRDIKRQLKELQAKKNRDRDKED